MLVVLYRRSYGVHRPVKIIKIKPNFKSLARYVKSEDEYEIEEEKLIAALPKKFLPVKPSQCLLTVGDNSGATGVRGLNRFRNWSKYFDSYVLEICQPRTKRQLMTAADERALALVGLKV